MQFAYFYFNQYHFSLERYDVLHFDSSKSAVLHYSFKYNPNETSSLVLR